MHSQVQMQAVRHLLDNPDRMAGLQVQVHAHLLIDVVADVVDRVSGEHMFSPRGLRAYSCTDCG